MSHRISLSASGSALAGLAPGPEPFHDKVGALRYTSDEPKYCVPSPDGKRGFRAECGSRIVWQALRPEDDWLTNVTVGSLDLPLDARMTRHISAGTKLLWSQVCEDLQKLAADNVEVLIAELRAELRPGL